MGHVRIADFAIERELGTGAMGTVYLARRGEEVFALKIIRAELIGTPEFVARFRREAEVGARVTHPNVVRTLGSGVATSDGAEVHYLVMEYVRGKDLRVLLQELGTVPEALLREIAVQTAAGLEAIHEAGVVHRDVKPENVLLTEANEVRIMDLGVARLRDASSALTREGDFTGTLLYAAPEQFVSAEVGPASDLYALGVLLYELATGTNPFVRSSSLAVMQAQIEVVPAPAQERNAAISPFLSEVVATLMAKRAEERFESAAALRRTLAAAEDSPWWKVRATQVARAALRVPRIPVERATASYGRKEELDALNTAWTSARGGVGGVVWIEGEAGIGKSRLLDEFVRGLGDGRRHVLYGAFPAAGGLRGVTEAIVDHFGEGDLGGRLRPHLEAYADLVPAFAARMRDECPPSGAAPLPPEALPTLTARLLQSLAEDAPVLWMVDDAHLARDEGARLLTALARATENRRVLLVVTSHEGRLAEGTFAALAALPTLRRLSLRRLGPRDVVLLLTEALQSEMLAESLGGRIAAKSDGVPLFVLEVLRALGEGGVLKRAADGSYVQARRITSFAVPSSVRGLVETRLKGLSDDDRELLDVAAVQGPDFDAALLARVLDLKPVLALRRLAVLERRTGMVRASGARYRFDQKQVQETLYEELPQELRQEYHALLAEAHREGRGDRVEGRDAYFLAANHLKGARPREALPWLEPALAWLEKALLHDEFFDLVEVALSREGLLAGKERGELLFRLASRLTMASGAHEAGPALMEALTIAGAVGDAGLAARVTFLDARLHAMKGDVASARAGFERARELAREAGDEELEARATGSVGVLLDNTGHHLEGLPMLEHHLAVARRRGDRKSEMIAACNLGLLLRHLGRPDEARSMMDLHQRLAVGLGDLHAEAVAHGNLSLLEADLGRGDAACAELERNVELARKIGSRRSEAIAGMNLATHYMDDGRIDRALTLLAHTRALLHEMGDYVTEASTEWNLGAAWTKVGRFDHARPHHERALELLRQVGDRGGEARVLVELGIVLLALGRRDDARASFEAGRTRAVTLELPKVEAAALLNLGGLARLEGDLASAVRFATEAQARAAVAGSSTLGTEAAIFRAELPGGDPAAATRALTEAGAKLPMPSRAKLYHRLWRVTKEPAHLATAQALLAGWIERVSPSLREGLELRMPELAAIQRDVAPAP